MKKSELPLLVCWDNDMGLCVPMMWDSDFRLALCGFSAGGTVAIFADRKSAMKSIDISAKWNALLKAQGRPYSEDFLGESRKHIRILPCSHAP